MDRKRQCDICYSYRSEGYLIPDEICGSNKKITVCYKCVGKVKTISCPACGGFDAAGDYKAQCDECAKVEATPCELCAKLTLFSCGCCDRSFCRSKLRFKYYHTSKYDIKSYDYNSSFVRKNLLCGDCCEFAGNCDIKKICAATFKKLYNTVHINKTLTYALKKYNMHDKLFVKSVTNIIVNL